MSLHTPWCCPWPLAQVTGSTSRSNQKRCRGAWGGSPFPLRAERLTVLTHTPLARIWSYGHTSAQERMGNVVFILGVCVSRQVLLCYSRGRTLGHVWGHLSLSHWGCSWHQVGGVQGCCSTPHGAQDGPPQSDLAPVSIMSRWGGHTIEGEETVSWGAIRSFCLRGLTCTEHQLCAGLPALCKSW